MTGFRYVVVRLMPDPERQELVNVGVVVAPENSVPLVRMVDNSSAERLRCLGYAGSVDFLQQVADDIDSWGTNASTRLTQALEEWGGTVRVSEVRGALHSDARALRDDLFERYVAVDAPPAPAQTPVHRARDRNAARSVARTSLRKVLPRRSVSTRPQIAGQVEKHKFDIGVQNGQLLHGIATLSFDIRTTRLLEAEVAACAWAFKDVRDADPNFPISVVTIGGGQRALLNRARAICDSLDIEVVPEASLDPWAKRIQAEVEPRLKQAVMHP